MSKCLDSSKMMPTTSVLLWTLRYGRSNWRNNRLTLSMHQQEMMLSQVGLFVWKYISMWYNDNTTSDIISYIFWNVYQNDHKTLKTLKICCVVPRIVTRIRALLIGFWHKCCPLFFSHFRLVPVPCFCPKKLTEMYLFW